MNLSRKPVILLLFAFLSVLVFSGCGKDLSGLEKSVKQNPFEVTTASMATMVKKPPNIQRFFLKTNKNKDYRGMLDPVEPTVIRTGNTSLMRIAITLDDGWNPDLRLLDLFKSYNIKFTAFLIGERGVCDIHPEFLQAIQGAGGEVCNHTATHSLMQGRDPNFVIDQIWRAQNNISRVTGRIYPYIRFLGGSYDDTSVNTAAAEGFYVVNWNLSIGDTVVGNTTDRQIAGVLNGLSPGSIILCHWGGYHTFDVLSVLIPEMQRRGYEVTSLTRVLEGTPYTVKSPL